MASLSNINGLFDVHSTGAILFSTSHGTSGQILRSNGNAAPTWVAASTVIGGPYLPLTGGTLTGATATASGISFTVGGALTGTTATFSTVQISNGNSYNENIRMFPGSNDYSSLVLGAVSGTSGSGVGQWTLLRYPTSTYSNKFSIRHNSTDVMVMTTGGTTTFTGLVSGITPTAAANFTTKDYVDNLSPPGGPYVTIGTAQTITANKTFSTLTSFTASESIHFKGARGQFTNEFMHLYNKVGIGNPAGWGQGETSTPNQGLSVYGGSNFAYGTSATSTFYGPITATGKILLNANNINFESAYSGNGLVLSHHGVGPSNAIVSGGASNPDTLFINNGGSTSDWSNVAITGNVGVFGNTNPTCPIDFGTSVPNYKRIIGTYVTGNLFTGIGMSATTAGIRIAGDLFGNNLLDIGYYSADGNYTWSSTMFINNTNVGIGTTSPSKKLHVVTTALFGPNGSTSRSTDGVGINFTNNNTFSANADLTDANRYLAITNDSTAANTYAPLSFRVNPDGGTSNAMADIKLVSNGSTHHLTTTIRNPATGNFIDTISIAQDGNVGIATTSPGHKLEVNGGIRAGIAGGSSGNIPGLKVYAASAQTDTTAAIAIQQGTGEGDTIIFADYEPHVEWGISAQNSTDQIHFTAGSSTNSLGSKTFYNNAGAARTAYIKFNHDLSDGTTLIGGNLGLGVTSATEKLVVAGKVMINNANVPNNYAQLNIGWTTSGGETRAIDIDGNWGGSESKSISFTHGTTATNIVGQINCQHNGPGSRIRWGKLYHGGDSSTYTMELISSSQTTADLTVSGNITASDRAGIGTAPDTAAAGDRLKIQGGNNGLGCIKAISGQYSYGVRIEGSNISTQLACYSSSTAQTTQINFSNTGNSSAGKITTTGNSTAYVTSSDYRLKENVIPISDSISRLNQLKPSRFNFIGESNKTVDGFIAHEVQDIVPEAIVGEKDEIDKDGNPVHQGIDQAKLVPLLVAALQELEARVKELENK